MSLIHLTHNQVPMSVMPLATLMFMYLSRTGLARCVAAGPGGVLNAYRAVYLAPCVFRISLFPRSCYAATRSFEVSTTIRTTEEDMTPSYIVALCFSGRRKPP